MAVGLAIDAGTTGVRAYVVDEQGRAVDWSYQEFAQHYPRPGWVEHDLDDIWAAVTGTLADVTERLRAEGRTLAAVGITNQRETVAAWSRRTGRPLARAIVWQDRRTAERCARLVEAGHLPLVRRSTGLVLDPYFTATKAAWLLEEGGVPSGDDLALGTIDAWLIWQLTGGTAAAGAVHVTDASNASRTLLFDLRSGAWSPELAGLFRVPLGALPAVGPSSGIVGRTAAGATPLPGGVAIAGVAGDQQAALFGQACFEVGMTKNTYGTGSFVLMNVGATCPPPVEGLLTTVAWRLQDGTTAYALEGSIFVTGAAVQWLRDGLGLIGQAAEVGPLAASVPDTGGVYLVPAVTGLGSPWWDPHARGTLVGITRGTGRAQLARAVVEAMAYQTRDVVDAMTAASGRDLRTLRVDGGASVMDLLLQLQADQLGVTVARPKVTETTAHGAALLAGLGAGVWGGLEETSARWALDVEVEPSPDRAGAEEAYRQWRRAVERSRDWASGDEGAPPEG
jgi:glycerol kinase